jgi:hypothetical protein
VRTLGEKRDMATMEIPKYTVTGDSVTVVWQGKTHSVQRGAPNFKSLREALMNEEWDKVPGFFTVALSIETWAKGRFKVSPDKRTISYDGNPLPHELNDRILNMLARGESPEPLFNFWERLQKNPSFRSVQQLWPFLAKKGIPLTLEGRFLAYKGLKHDYKDVHTGTVDNRPGTINKMPRNMISDDPNHSCHYGFHVGAESYARSFSSGQTVVCEVDPEHVVCIPYDHSHEKMRVCEYKVIGNYGTTLPSTIYDTAIDVHKDEDEEEPEDEDLEDDEDEDLDENDTDEDGNVIDPKDPDEESEEESEEDEGLPPEVEFSKPPKGFAKIHKMDMKELMEQSIDELRKYAGKGLSIVGASKIPGGKTVLVKRIVEVRHGSAKKD